MRYHLFSLFIGLFIVALPNSEKCLSAEQPSTELIHAYIVVASKTSKYFRGIEYDAKLGKEIMRRFYYHPNTKIIGMVEGLKVDQKVHVKYRKIRRKRYAFVIAEDSNDLSIKKFMTDPYYSEGGTTQSMKSEKVQIWTEDAQVLSFEKRTGGILQEVYVDFRFNKAVQITTEFSDNKPFKSASEKKLADNVIKEMKRDLQKLSLERSIAKIGPPPGGSFHYEVLYGNQLKKGGGSFTRQTPKILSRENGVSRGTEYYVLNPDDEKQLTSIIMQATGNGKN